MFKWIDANLHRYLAAAILLLGLLYVAVSGLPKPVTTCGHDFDGTTRVCAPGTPTR